MMPRPTVNQTRLAKCEVPTASLALLDQVGAMPGTPGAGPPSDVGPTRFIRPAERRPDRANGHPWGAARPPLSAPMSHARNGSGRSARLQHRIDDAPGCLDRVLARELHLVTLSGVAQEPLIGRALRVGLMASEELDILSDHRLT